MSLSETVDNQVLADVPAVPVQALAARLGLTAPIDYPSPSLRKPLIDWNMAQDDAPILRYLYRELRPQRHLEFGTWMGAGVVDVLTSCDAEVWTLNLPEGERGADGRWAYYQPIASRDTLPPQTPHFVTRQGQIVAQTDGPGFIGKYYHERGLAHRVHQILCDSRAWDTSDYPPGFFDTALIDGGHVEDVVDNDARKALPLVRSGGLVMWHDFCPDATVRERCPCVRGVIAGLNQCWPYVREQCHDVFWVEPSWLLIGVKR